MNRVRQLVVAVACGSMLVGLLSCAQTLSSSAIAVRVDCNVPEATVWIDDVLVWTTSSWRSPRQLRAGLHRVEIRHPGYYSFF